MWATDSHHDKYCLKCACSKDRARALGAQRKGKSGEGQDVA